MPVTMARLSGFQSAKSARWYQALTGPTQATGSAGGYDLFVGRPHRLRDAFALGVELMTLSLAAGALPCLRSLQKGCSRVNRKHPSQRSRGIFINSLWMGNITEKVASLTSVTIINGK